MCCDLIPDSSSFMISPVARLYLIPLRSSGMWEPVTIILGILFVNPKNATAGEGSLPKYCMLYPLLLMALHAAARMRSVLERKSPPTAMSMPGVISLLLSRYRKKARVYV